MSKAKGKSSFQISSLPEQIRRQPRRSDKKVFLVFKITRGKAPQWQAVLQILIRISAPLSSQTVNIKVLPQLSSCPMRKHRK